MINQYYKQQKDYDDKIKKLGQKLMHIEEKLETEDANEILKGIDDDNLEIDE
jgi:hypothetical protein